MVSGLSLWPQWPALGLGRHGQPSSRSVGMKGVFGFGCSGARTLG